MPRIEYIHQETSDIHHVNARIDMADNTPAPCVTCPYAHRCAIQNLACRDFLRYVQLRENEPLAKVRIPSRRYYDRIYKMHEYEISILDGETSCETLEFNPADSDFACV